MGGTEKGYVPVVVIAEAAEDAGKFLLAGDAGHFKCDYDALVFVDEFQISDFKFKRAKDNR